MHAAFTLREERVHENEAILDATFRDPSAFLSKIGAQGAGDGGSAKSLALVSAVKKWRKRESRDAPPTGECTSAAMHSSWRVQRRSGTSLTQGPL